MTSLTQFPSSPVHEEEPARVIVSGVQPQPRAMLGRIGLGEAAGRISYAADYAGAQALAVDLADAK